jgi:peptidoglycan/xylan/chitin deacetylase (PgdA/CDA1 family)
MNPTQRLKVAFLLGSDNESTRLAVERVCALPNVHPIVAIQDAERPSFARRFKNLRRNVRREGWKYVPIRCVGALRNLTERFVESAVVSRGEPRRILETAFPDKSFSVQDLSGKYGFTLSSVSNLNGPEALSVLKAADVDLGIVIGTRILKEHIFSVPKLGSVNLHKGKVPEYRGMPTGFWELYDGVASAEVTIHFVDRGLDSGDVLATSRVPISPRETPDSLREKLHEEGANLLASSVSAIQAGSYKRQKQEYGSHKSRSKPTSAEVNELRKKLPHWCERSNASMLAKNLYTLIAYYSGLYSLVRISHRFSPTRACIILYHRVNDYSKDVLTVDTRTFVEQLIALAMRYPIVSTHVLVDTIRQRKKLTPTTVAIHFDDCYRDVFLNGAPILKALGYPAAAFISSGFVDTNRSFAHDRQKYPFRYPNLRAGDVRSWVADGFEIGAHTVNHVDLGKCSIEEGTFEIVESRRQLELLLMEKESSIDSHEIPFFSFPFGRNENIRPEMKPVVRDAGYSALFSAHGGFVSSKTDVYDIPRMGSSGQTCALYLLLEIEGLGPAQLLSRFKALLGRCGGQAGLGIEKSSFSGQA